MYGCKSCWRSFLPFSDDFSRALGRVGAEKTNLWLCRPLMTPIPHLRRTAAGSRPSCVRERPIGRSPAKHLGHRCFSVSRNYTLTITAVMEAGLHAKQAETIMKIKLSTFRLPPHPDTFSITGRARTAVSLQIQSASIPSFGCPQTTLLSRQTSSLRPFFMKSITQPNCIRSSTIRTIMLPSN